MGAARIVRIVAVAVLTSLAGCASGGGVGADSRSDFVFRGGWAMANARLDGNDLFGMGVSVAHRSGDYRGWVGPRAVHLSTRGSRLIGMVGIEPTELTVEDHPQALVVRGSFGGDSGVIALTGGHVVGRIGRCVYDLRRRDPRAVDYEGVSDDAERRPLRFRVPADLAARPAAERAAFLALFLMWTCGGPHTTIATASL
jgi:hypothetical protein